MKKSVNILKKVCKKFAFLGAVFVPASADAQSVYQCLPCPEGQSSPAGSTSISQCSSAADLKGTLIKDCTTSNCSGKLEKGWYRVTIHTTAGSKGSNASKDSSSSNCHPWDKQNSMENCFASIWGGTSKCITIPLPGTTRVYGSKYEVKGASGTGGKGGSGFTKSYVFYLSSEASYSYDVNGGSPKIVISKTSTEPQRVFQLSKAGNGTNATVYMKDKTCGNGGYAECCTETWTGTNGSDGANSVELAPSGLQYRDTSSNNFVDGYTSATGIRISKIS